VQIVAVSFGEPDVTSTWVAEEKFPFEVWTDDARTLATAYGASPDADDGYPKRITVILDASGAEVLRYDSVSVRTHPEDVLADCKILFGSP
jgi:peroxiredoxin